MSKPNQGMRAEAQKGDWREQKMTIGCGKIIKMKGMGK